MLDKKNLRKYSTGEIYWLDRRFKRLTWVKAAKAHGLSENMYGALELDRRPPINGSLPKLPRSLPKGLLCELARRRHGMPLLTTAKFLGISHTELITRERNSDPRLADAWRNLGYKF